MEVFDIFKNLELIAIGKYMVVELFLGIFAGIVFKQVAKFQANQANTVQVFRATEYSSKHFGKNFPRGAFDPFKLSSEFIIVQYNGDEVISEQFFSFLGDSTKAEYSDGQYKHSFSALSSPLYLTTVLIPIMLGFLFSLLPIISKIGNLLLVSGLIWMFMTLWMPMFLGFQGNRASNVE